MWREPELLKDEVERLNVIAACVELQWLGDEIRAAV